MTEVNSWELTYYTGLFYIFLRVAYIRYLWVKFFYSSCILANFKEKYLEKEYLNYTVFYK
jgi:hypothetical protein